MTDTSVFDNDVRVALYRFFVREERAPVAAEVASELEASPFDVEASFERLADVHVLVLTPGTKYVSMANPLSALPTPFRAKVDGKRYWANCIWDGLGTVAMLGGTGRVTARCADCAEGLELDVVDRVVTSTDFVVHYAVPAARWWDDIGFT
jgi:hypothetical protein